MIHALLLLVAQTQYDHGNPTPDEQLILEIINRARSNPTTEGARLKTVYPSLFPSGDIKEGLSGADAALVAAKPPLAFNPILIGTARAHSFDMYNRNFFDHTNPDGKDPFQRMTAAGYAWDSAGENIAVGSSTVFHTAAYLEDSLMIDSSIAGRGHRKNLLDIYGSPPYREIGIGYYANAVANPSGWEVFLSQDFGRIDASGPFLVGVVYWDRDGDNFYTQGEGLGGVKITVTGTTAFAITSSSGGFAVPLPGSGPVNVTATGFNLPGSTPTVPGSLTVTSVPLTGENVKVDFKITLAAMPDTNGNGLPDLWETNYPLSANPNSDQDGDTFTSIQEFRGGSKPDDSTSTPVPPPPPPPTPSPPPGAGSSSGGGKKHCGATGLEAALVLSLLALSRRARR
jgi:hypothetical protein